MSRRTSAGAAVLIASRLIARCIDFAALLVLARLLSPADFGLVAIAMAVIMVTEAALELSLWQALVRLPLTRAHFDTAFTLALLRALVVVLILFVAAWPLARLYGDDRLIPLIYALALAPAVRGLGSARMIEYVKKLDYRREFVLEFAGKVAAFIVSVSLAWYTGSYWALAAGTIAAPITTVIASYVLAPYRPRLTLRKWRSFAGFLGWSTAAQVVNALNWQMDQLVLGRFVNPIELGRFAMAANLAALPAQVFIARVLSPLMVTFSFIKKDHRRLTLAYQNSAITILAAGLPMMVGISVMSEPLLRLVLGAQWMEAADVLRWLSLAVVPAFFFAPLAPLSMALNRTEIFLRLALLELFFRLPIVLVGAISYGVTGIVVARLATAFVMAASSAVAVRELLGLSLRAQVFSAWRPVVSTLAMALVIIPMEAWLANVRGLPLALGMSGVIFVAVVVYAGTIFILWRLAGCPEGFESKIVGALAHYWRAIVTDRRIWKLVPRDEI
ncbi:lipopolysaccharide biosynthesis protein [Bradyrhizobium sp. LHD-71]|uniref:lipopolysaccharide biosynthesis protein n=1 Tax=Bradyrhizobium sp. LHD-71 TaxID=3072141 RepID=UPI00280EBE08|nr:lipopolysaccharide biosynthesis protein [Bradyrhizobium sp. LHD-71]MDQ8727661.1 lipopolysaccharide biosynthesis protein [Bradyrhizobium sp. LHD-71]